uniref:ATP synthase complex subunit 8 n=1 Tax=Archetypus frenchi TaxID=2546585 RepID=A0A6H0N6N3_9CUCU|nr:ATP synthase F0 subunit 8 [Archetypus frenchi]
MPQMAPLSWLTLFFVFILVFLIFNIINFFSFIYEAKTSATKKEDITLNWKW